MLIGQGGYSKVWNPPRKDRIIEKKYWSTDFIQRLTSENLRDIYKGQRVRFLFDKDNKMSSPLFDIYERPHHFYSEIRPYRDDNLRDLLIKNKKGTNIKLFCSVLSNLKEIMKGLVVIHKHGWVHHDIKTPNILYNMKPFRLFLIDWATSVRSIDVYSDVWSPWFGADNMNHPPEYKSYAHYRYNYPFQENDFATDYSNNTYILVLKRIQPKYFQLLNKANDDLQKEFEKDNHCFLEKIAPKVDVFAMGLVIARVYLVLAYASLINTQFDKKMRSLLQNMTHPDPLKRWTMKRSLKHLSPLVAQACALVK
jgi:serine/threonine protein kinase